RIISDYRIDSRYNEGCTELAKYLFYGLYERNPVNLEHVIEEFPEEMLDDVILLIKAECVHLYCNPLNFSYLLPYVSHWRNLHLYCMTKAEYEDEEAAEEFKISSFVSMVQDCYRIGVPYSSQGHIQRFDMFMVEKWPLIQAFALEGIGGGSFFTMKYELMDMSEKLWQVYNRLDPVSLDNLLTEAFRTYYSHGLISSSITDKSKSQQPLVLFGKHSSLKDLESYSFNFPSESHQVRNTGPQASTARHMILQCVAPKGPLACSRTYFFGTTHTPYLGEVYHVTYGILINCMFIYLVFWRYFTHRRKAMAQVPNQHLKWILFPPESPPKICKCDLQFCHSFSSINCCFFHQRLKLLILFLSLGKIIFFSDGLLFVHSQYGSITLSKDHISSIKFYNPDSSAVASLFVEYESSLLPHLPFPLHSSDQCLVFALQPSSKSHKAFYSKIIMVFKSFFFRHKRLQKLHDSQEPPVAKRRGSLKTSYSQLPEQEMFLQHFALSSIGQEPILYDHLGVLFPSAELRNPAAGQVDKVVITIITGLPGSYKKRLSSFLVNLNKECGRWVVYEPDPDRFSASHLQQYLSSFLESQRGTRGKPRLLVLSPGYTDVLDIIQAVLFHPDPVVQACFTIGAVTACVNPLASCMEHRFAFPKLLEQCSQGIVSTVVFTGLTAEEKHPLMQHVQQLVRSANPTAAFILAERGAVTRNEDVMLILSESSFSEPPMLRARYVLYPGCSHFFSAVIKSSLRPSPFQGNVYNIWGKVRFSDSDRLMEVSYNAASGSLSVVPDQSADPPTPGPKENNTSCFLVFDGVGLTEDGLKDWLRLCAKQRQTKKAKRTKNTLTPQEIKSIHATRHLDPLPPGYFYNGYQYVDIFGEKRSFHPNMDEFIKEYVSEANKQIEHFNRQLEFPCMFAPSVLFYS
uniref:Uncharacterized protein n=1 Tax=Amphiprion ocellaris TaxID=80972 RepID=A0AAQ5YCI3_AMPOC